MNALERQVAAEQAAHEGAQEAAGGDATAGEGVKSPDAGEAAHKAAAALAWLDTTLEELRGALTACGEAIEAGTLAPEVVSSKMNALVMEMMAGGAG